MNNIKQVTNKFQTHGFHEKYLLKRTETIQEYLNSIENLGRIRGNIREISEYVLLVFSYKI